MKKPHTSPGGRTFRLRIMALVAVVICFNAATAFALETGPGEYRHEDRETGKTLTVWYYKPADFDARTPVVIIMHGMGRNGKSYRDSWARHAQAKNFMLLVPEFSKKDFPGSEAYNLGNYMLPDKRVSPKSKWSYTIIERIFDDFKTRREKTDVRKYYLYGHSAGAQFVHRLLLLLPEARVQLAVSANAGFYTMPDFTKEWPYGIKDTNLPKDSLRQYLAVPMVVLLGEKDNDPNHSSLPRAPQAYEQGDNRFARGNYFFDFCQNAAKKSDIPFNWKRQTVPGAGHSNKLMSVAAVELFAADMAADKAAAAKAK
ncbi:alpha/beta hydrolase [Ereboglobus luteus]|nr:alpha/beta hydrolase [Ereboglobus luteus]